MLPHVRESHPVSFEEIVEQALAMHQRRGRVSYRALQRQFALDDAYLEDVKAELLYAYPPVVDDAGRGLRWTGDTALTQLQAPPAPQPAPQPVTQAAHLPQGATLNTAPRPPEAERRQLTVPFCDLVCGSVCDGQSGRVERVSGGGSAGRREVHRPAGSLTLVAGEHRAVWPRPGWEVNDGPQTNRGGKAFGGWHQAER